MPQEGGRDSHGPTAAEAGRAAVGAATCHSRDLFHIAIAGDLSNKL